MAAIKRNSVAPLDRLPSEEKSPTPEDSQSALSHPDGLWTSDPEGEIRIKFRNSTRDSKTWVEVFDQAAAGPLSERVAYVTKRHRSRSWTFKQARDEIVLIAKAFIHLGLEPFHGVGILGYNSPEWVLGAFGAIYAAGLVVGIYTTNSAEACEYILSDSKCNIVLVEDDKQLEKIIMSKHNLPHLKNIVVWDPTVQNLPSGIHRWSELKEIGGKVSDAQLMQRLKMIKSNRCCSVIYTSGTTGPPKGVMLSHDNYYVVAKYTAPLTRATTQEIIISYLPLSHVASQVVDIFCSLVTCARIYFTEPDVLRGGLLTALLDARPTIFLGVPRIYEKIYENIQVLLKGPSFTPFRRKIFLWATRVGEKGVANRAAKKMKPIMLPLAEGLVLSKIKARLGLDECRIFISGAAPLSRDVLTFFSGLNIAIQDVFGLSECTGPATMNTPVDFRLGSIGRPIDGCEVMIKNPDEKGVGELCFKGRNVMMGYLGNPQKTKEAIDEDGYMHTGDLGSVDKDGFVYITGRIKELIITAGGENVPPVPIEDKIKEFCPIISNCVLIGDMRKFLTMLVTLKPDADPATGLPTTNLAPIVLLTLAQVGSNSRTMQEAKEDKIVRDVIQSAISKYNKMATSNAQRIQKFTIMEHEFTIAGGEMTGTLKLKRNVVHEKYHDLIEKMYKVDE